MRKILLSCCLIAGIAVSAQVTGTKTIGVDYASLDAAFADLNVSGVGVGGATINIPAGYTENAPVGGFLLGSTTLNATLTVANPLIIQKNGAGVNPLFTGAIGTTSGATGVDSIFKFVGVDYMTLDGLDLQENAANIDAITLNERGFAFYNLSATDGCNYNTIKNSTITFLKTVNNTATGIYFGHTDTAGVAIVPTSVDGTNSNNKIYSNTISKSLGSAIGFTGYAAPSPYTLYDQNNDIGGTSAATGNTITDFGGLAGGSFYITSYGIYAVYQNNANSSNNMVTFASDGLGTVGMYLYGTNSTFTANDNTINAVGQTYSVTPSVHTGIYSNAGGTNLTANNNKINISATIFNGAAGVSGINFPGTGNLTANGNIIVGGTSPSTFYGIYGSGVTVDLNNNNISGLTSTGASTNVSGIYLTKAATGNISSNKIYNLQANGATGSVYGIYAGGSTASTTTKIFNNLIGDLKTPAVSSTIVSLVGLYLGSSGVTSNLNVYYNTIYLNGSSTGVNFNSAGIYHLNSTTATTAALDLRNNMIVNSSVPNGSGTASALRRSVNGVVNYAATSDNNNLYGTSFAFVGSTTGSTLAQFQTLGRDANSMSVQPVFSSTSGASADFLNLNPVAGATQTLDNKGAPIATYLLDYTGASRSATTPDMGAYEFVYVPPTVLPDCATITAPVNMSSGVSPNPTTISWTAANNATTYKLMVGISSGDSSVLNLSGLTSLSYAATLSPNTTYYAKVIATNSIGDATGCTEISFTTGAANYCTAASSSVTFEYITRVKFGSIDNATAGVSGYNNFTNQSTTVRRNNSEDLIVKIKPYTSGGDYVYAYFDWNHDGLVSADETYVFPNTNTLTVETELPAYSIMVPATAQLGATRVRIVISDSSTYTGCGTISFGEVEDYTLNVDVALATGNTAKANLAVYPNPFQDILKISDVKGVKSISVSDMSGRQVKNLNPSAELNLTDLKSGLYIITLKMEDGTVQSFKTIKK